MKGKLVMAIAALAIIAAAVIVPNAMAGNGNGAPTGSHYNLNIIGVPNEKNNNFDGGNGARIFVSRTGSTQFYVHGGDSYAILDHDGTDGKVGTGLTDPGIIFPYNATATPTWRVQIWVRQEGPLDSSSHWTTAYWNGTAYVLWDEFTLTKDAPSKFTEKTSALLADGYQDILWTLEPVTKFRNLQMRIYLTPR